jgi:hypothetical protein
MIRLANGIDGLPDGAALTRHMLDWCATNLGHSPAESVVREWIAKLDPRKT